MRRSERTCICRSSSGPVTLTRNPRYIATTPVPERAAPTFTWGTPPAALTGSNPRIPYATDTHGGPPGRVSFTIVEKPSYGKITVRPDHILARPSSLPSRSKACIGKFYDMAAVFYKPSPRFHGSDRMVVRVKFAAWPGGTPPTREEVIYISVR